MKSYTVLRNALYFTFVLAVLGLSMAAVYPPVILPYKEPAPPSIRWSTTERGVVEIHLDTAKDPVTGSPVREIRIFAHPSQRKNVKVTYNDPVGR